MKLSVIIPAYNEEGCIESTVRALYRKLSEENIEHEILIVYDDSSDRTWEILEKLVLVIPTLRLEHKRPPKGFGLALRRGLEIFSGDAAVFYTSDASDSPDDLVLFFRTMEKEGVDCVFGSRFIKGGKTIDYPPFKYFLNRTFNNFIRFLFGFEYNDITNGFKLYRRGVIEGTGPYLSRHFNFSAELALKAVNRGYTFAVVPNSWTNRKAGKSNFNVQKLAPIYLFTVFYCFFEKKLLRHG